MFKDLQACWFIQQIDVTGVHIDGRYQAGLNGSFDVTVKTFPVHIEVGQKGEQCRGNTCNLTMRDDSIGEFMVFIAIFHIICPVQLKL